jgi:hypothetical protein
MLRTVKGAARVIMTTADNRGIEISNQTSPIKNRHAALA